MKKNVIALAVAAAMAAPLAAQAEVTVSGGLQAEITSLSADEELGAVEGLYMFDGHEAGNEAGGWGHLKFSASEDLGNGLKALAMYNFNVQADDAANGARDAYVGLSGNFGTVLAGRMSSPYKSSTVSWDPFLATSAQARGNFGMSGLHNSYVSNALAYANKFGMATIKAAIVFDEAADDETPSETSGDHAMSFSVNVPVGPVEVAIAHINMDDFGTNPATVDAGPDFIVGTPDDIVTPASETGDYNATKAGVKYAAGALGVAAQYETITQGDVDTEYMYVNGTYTAGANTFAIAYGQNEADADQAPTPSYMAVGMVHSMSKNVRAHVGYIAMDTDTDAGEASGIAAGLRVKF